MWQNYLQPTSLEGALENFYPGFRRTALQPEELIREIRIPEMQSNQRGMFVRLGLRRVQAKNDEIHYYLGNLIVHRILTMNWIVCGGRSDRITGSSICDMIQCL